MTEKYDNRAHRLVAGRLFEISTLSGAQATRAAREVLHTLAADGYVLARWTPTGPDGQRELRKADDPPNAHAWEQ
jgi:hypothetical protein